MHTQRIQNGLHLRAGEKRRRSSAEKHRVKRGGITPAARNKLQLGEKRFHIAFRHATLGKADEVAIGALSHAKRNM